VLIVLEPAYVNEAGRGLGGHLYAYCPGIRLFILLIIVPSTRVYKENNFFFKTEDLLEFGKVKLATKLASQPFKKIILEL